MNIFVLHEKPWTAAEMMCDKHIPKMIVESIQMLVQGLLNNGAPGDKMPLTKTKQEPHKGGYATHPCTMWASYSLSNWIWLYAHAEALCLEYTRRYGKVHYGSQQLEHLTNTLVWSDYLPRNGKTDFVRAVNQSQGRNLDLLTNDMTAVQAYRIFYMREKARFAKWGKGRPAPEWWKPQEVKA